MTRKQVWRYKCDFCKKRYLSAPAMANHEKHCTMNPNRECRMCVMVEHDQLPMAQLLVMLPAPVMGQFGAIENVDQINDSIPRLRDATGNCPACIMAALRQKGIPIPATEFNFSEECKAIWAEINEAKLEEYNCGY